MGETPTPSEPVQSQPPVASVQSAPSKLWLRWTLGLVILLAIGVGIWWMRRPSNIPSPTVTTGTVTTPAATTASDPTANWKTYNNTAYNFSLKYPQDWVTDHNKHAGETVTLTSPETIKAIAAQIASTGGQDFGPISDDIRISYYDKVSDLAVPNVPALKGQTITLDSLLSKYKKDLTLISDVTDTTLGVLAAKEVVIGGEAAYYTILVERDGHLFEIFFNNVDSKQNLTTTEKQILGSFVFTQSTASSINKDIEKVDFSKIISVNTKIGDALETPTYADLNSDNYEEALVVHRISGTAAFADFYIYGMKDGSPIQLLKDSGNGKVEIKNGSVYYHVTDPDSTVNKGKSNVDMVAEYFKYTWNGTTFAKSGQ